jgi:hypothetical protein
MIIENNKQALVNVMEQSSVCVDYFNPNFLDLKLSKVCSSNLTKKPVHLMWNQFLIR